MSADDDAPDGGAPEAPSADQDVVLLCSPTEDGEGVNALRARADRVELAEIRPLKEGQPVVAGEVARLKPREEMPLVCDVDVTYSAPTPEALPARSDHAGPPRISSGTYRKNWDKVFKPSRSRRPPKHKLN